MYASLLIECVTASRNVGVTPCLPHTLLKMGGMESLSNEYYFILIIVHVILIIVHVILIIVHVILIIVHVILIIVHVILIKAMPL